LSPASPTVFETAPLSNGDKERFREALAAGFDRAATRGRVQRWLSIGRWRWRVEIAGEQVASSLLRAIDHLRADSDAVAASADLTLLVWDEASTGIGLPACPWPAPRFYGRGDLDHGWGPDVHAVFSIDSQVLQYLDAPSRFAVCWMRDPALLQPWERAAPLRSVLAGWARAVGGFLIHAAGVGIGDDGVLLTGPSGSGKSTTALACLAHGMMCAGDDFVMIAPSAEGVDLYGLFGSAKVVAAELAGQAKPALSDGSKTVLWINESHPRQMARHLRLRAIVVPLPSGRAQPLLRRASPVEVIRALLPSSAFLTAGADGRSYAGVIDLVRGLPAFVLELGEERAQNAEILEGLLRAG
jgi:hypothetical protein